MKAESGTQSKTERLRVPSGWLVKVITVHNAKPMQSVVFVPDKLHVWELE